MFSVLTALVLASSGANAEAVGRCRSLMVEKRAGEPIFAEDVQQAACPEKQPAALTRYDSRRKLVMARVDLSIGTNLGLAYLPDRPPVAAGQAVRLTYSVGHVRLSRSAVALQSARPGERFFVRTEDGSVFAAPPLASGAGGGNGR